MCPRSQRDLCLLPPESSSAALPPPSGAPPDILLCIHRFYIIVRFCLFSPVQGTDSLFSEHVIRLKPEQEVRGHPLGPACLALSPHHLWLASVGQDGLLCVRETALMVDCLACFFKTLELFLPHICCLCLLPCRTSLFSCGVTRMAAVAFAACCSLQTARLSSLSA